MTNRVLLVKIVRNFILYLLLFIAAQNLSASGKRLGTAGGIELTIPMGARNVGRGCSNIANIQGTESIYWNPAGLALTPHVEVEFSYINYFADMNINYFALGANVGNLGVLGISFQSFNIGDIEVTTIDSPEGTGEVYTPTYMTLGGTYSRAFTDRIYFGLNAKFITERIASMSGSAIAFDFGLQYTSPWKVDFGIVIRNIGQGIEFHGTGVEFDSPIPYANPNATTRKTALDMAKHELPAEMNFGIGYRYELMKMHNINVSSYYGDRSFNVDILNIGLEYSYRELFFVRTGYNQPCYHEDRSSSITEYQFGLAFGFGIHLKLDDKKIMIDYAYRNMDLWDANQYINIGFAF